MPVKNIRSFHTAIAAPRHRQGGVSMIEVLIAVLIMGIGLLGMAAMQTTALRNSQSAMERSQAAMQAYSILDAMRANADAARIGQYNLAAGTCVAPVADGSLARADLIEWFGTMQEEMGADSCAEITCGALECNVAVSWNDSRGSGGDSSQSFQAETRL